MLKSTYPFSIFTLCFLALSGCQEDTAPDPQAVPDGGNLVTDVSKNNAKDTTPQPDQSVEKDVSKNGMSPTVQITSPSDNSNVVEGTNISLEATASDTEDGDLSASIVWNSDADGDIGTGANISTALTKGAHRITATATDSDGLVGSATIRVSVNPMSIACPGGTTPTFGAETDIADGTVSGVSSMDAGKIDNDALIDILVVEGGKHAGDRTVFAWFKAPSNGQTDWTRHDIDHNANLKSFLGSTKLADMDGDGDLDILLSSDNHSGGSREADLFLFINPGTTDDTWIHHELTPTLSLHHINDMEAGDLDGDGKLDVVEA